MDVNLLQDVVSMSNLEKASLIRKMLITESSNVDYADECLLTNNTIKDGLDVLLWLHGNFNISRHLDSYFDRDE